MKTLSAIIESLRPKQWTKNLLLLAALIFSSNLFNLSIAVPAFEAFFVFCLISGSVYLLNDLIDKKQDRLHPTKKFRPIASGRLNTGAASAAWIIAAVVSLGWAFALNSSFGMIVLSYFLMQALYSLLLKNLAIVDIFIIALGFILRVIAGAVIIKVPMSTWFIVCTMFLSLFLALGKRRFELVSVEAGARRASLKGYSVGLLDQMMTIVTACTVMTYALYTLAPETVSKFHTSNLIYTLPFVLFGIFRYLYLIYTEGKGGSPEDILLSDNPLIADILLYWAAVWFILYKHI